MKRFSFFFVLLFTILYVMPDVVHAQEIKNVRFYQDSNKIIITYDLISKDIRGLFDVTAYYTIDNGKTFIPLRSTTGDIGKDIKKGENKKIIWNVLDDIDGIISEIQFKIVAEPKKIVTEPQKIVADTKKNKIKNYLISDYLINDYLILNINIFFPKDTKFPVKDSFPTNTNVLHIIGLNLSYGWAKDNETKIGILISGNFDHYEYYNSHCDYNYLDRYDYHYEYNYAGINFGLMYKLLNNPKFKLIYYGQLGLNLTVPMYFYYYNDYNRNTIIFRKHYITSPFPISTGFIFNINRFNILTGIKIYNNKIKNFKEVDEYIQNNYNYNLKYIPPDYEVGLSFGIGFTF